MSQYRYIFHKNLYANSEILCFKIMNLLASFALGGFNPWAAGFGIGSLVLFGLVGLVAGPNLKNFDIGYLAFYFKKLSKMIAKWAFSVINKGIV